MIDLSAPKQTYCLVAQPHESGERLDKFLHGHLPALTRNQVQTLIAAGQVQAENNAPFWHKNYAVRAGEHYYVHVPQPKPSHLEPFHYPLDIVYEDAFLLVLNKPAGMTVHPGAGTGPDTLAHALIAHCGDSLSGIGGVARPGLIHRLDRDTTGLLIVAKQDRAHIALSSQLKKREISRQYIAFCWGGIEQQQGSIETGLGRSLRDRKKMSVYSKHAPHAKLAITHYSLQETLVGGNIVLLRFVLETGRTHQIRVHAAHQKFPLIGDKAYGGQPPGRRINALTLAQREAVLNFSRQALHAERLEFTHPVTQEQMHFRAEWPEDMLALYRVLQQV